MEKLESDRLKRLEELVSSEEHEILETDETQPPLGLFVIIGITIIFAAVMLLLFYTVSDQTVSQTLGTHFQRR